MKITMNYELAMAGGQDEGDRNMRKNGRNVWNEEDWNVATDKVEELYPSPKCDNKVSPVTGRSCRPHWQ